MGDKTEMLLLKCKQARAPMQKTAGAYAKE
jgi:hypothetical protein